jgi:hypothetical protein
MDDSAAVIDDSGLALRRPLRLLDVLALTLGYALAAILVRTFWPGGPYWSPALITVLGLVYLWLGLCMSGPLILLLERRGPLASSAARRPVNSSHRPPPGRVAEPIARAIPSRYTWAELAWMSIGAYWIGMTGFLIPSRLRDTPLAMLLVLQVLAAFGLWVVVPSRRSPDRLRSAWTHRAAVGLLASWPLVWVALIYLAWDR